MSARSVLHQHQRDWAIASARSPDLRGYVASYDLNLFQPLSPAALRAFTQGSGSELLPSPSRPAKMAALHSSSALAVNAFDYWSGKPLAPVASALGLEPGPDRFGFEAQFPTGLGGTPPNLDLAFSYPDGRILGVESKFSEWLAPKTSRKEPFKAKYFPQGELLWSRVGLPSAQRLAESMQKCERAFRHLDAAQLLKHMLGLATAAPGKVSLYYIYYDCPGPESLVHRAEIETFSDLVGTDMRFYSTSYQRFFARLRTALGEEHGPYLDYVSRRYCQGADP
jgi:hypothetical protein